MKTDARVRYTRQALKSALLKLLEDKPINKITVKEVCQAAELNRATFYLHFPDCYALLEQIENDLIEDYVASLKYLRSFDVTDLIMAIFDMIDRNIDLCRILVFKNSNTDIIRRMIDITHEEGIAYWRSQLKKAGSDQLEMLFSCLANGLAYVVVDGYGKYDRKEMVDFVNSVVRGSVSVYM